MNNITSFIPEVSKEKVFEIIACIEECIFTFFSVFDAEDEYFEVTRALAENDVAIPDDLLELLEFFVYEELESLISNPNTLLEQLPPVSNTLEGTRTRNSKLIELEISFREEHFDPLKHQIKDCLLYA